MRYLTKYILPTLRVVFTFSTSTIADKKENMCEILFLKITFMPNFIKISD